MNESSYIFDISEKEINAVLFDLGSKYDRINALIPDKVVLYSERYDIKEKPISNSAFQGLQQIGFIDDTYYHLTDEGRKYFELKFILKEDATVSTIIKQKLLLNPIVNLIWQVFYGRGKISVEQLKTLLNYHQVANWEIENKEITSLLILLNHYQILTYDKKNQIFYLKEPLNSDNHIKQYFVNPTTPFSNIYNMRKVIRSCIGDIYWVDKHFRKEGLEIILDGLAHENVTSVTIISGAENVTQSAKFEYELLRQELSKRSITLLWRVINDKSFKWHDRWIVSQNMCYNVPPVLSIIRGQRADILKTETSLDVQPFMDIGVDITA